MKKFKFAASEICFPTWGALAFEMAAEAGFEGIEIADGGEYIEVHPLAKGYVEYERMGLDMRRLDSFPLSDKEVREYYLEAAERTGLEIMNINLPLLNKQDFAKLPAKSLKGQEYLKTIKVACEAAREMKIPSVSVPVKGMFGTAQNTYALEKLKIAREYARENGVTIRIYCDQPIARQMEFYEALGGEVKFDFFTIDPEVLAWEHPWNYVLEKEGAERSRGTRGLAVAAIKEFSGKVGLYRTKDLGADSEGLITMETGVQCESGEGDCDLKGIAAAIKATGYEGWILSDNKYFRPDIFERHGGSASIDYVGLAKLDLAGLKKAFE